MFKHLWQAVERACSGQAAHRTIADISRYHRIQASPGFRRAAELAHDILAQTGLRTQLLQYPANLQTAYWGQPSFQEWDAQSATLHLVSPQEQACTLADFRETPISLIQRSTAFDGQVDVVCLEQGVRPEEYESVDVAGKLVLARGKANRVHDLAVRRRGAAGILFDGMAEVNPVRPAWALPDDIQYTSFWWQHEDPNGFGFAVSPRAGQRLRSLARGETPILLNAQVDARLYNGALEVVNATIPGRTDEEIVLVAHLCHPYPSCNDNGSGAAAVLEVARALQNLIARGTLAPPQRTLRFLLLPEINGVYPFLAAHEERIPHMVAGLNLDMVGQDQTVCGSTFLIERPPDALPSFAPDLLICLREMFLEQGTSYADLGSYSLSRHAVTPFGGGSDHAIFSDPQVGVPMPMLIQWPDKFYHTTADTLDKVDPHMLGQTCALAATYVYWLAQAGEAEARWLASEMSARYRRRTIARLQSFSTQVIDENGAERGTRFLERQTEYQIDRHRQALNSIKRLAPIDVTLWQERDEQFTRSEWARMASTLPAGPDETEADEEGKSARLIPQRVFRGLAQINSLVDPLDATIRDTWWNLAHHFSEKASRTVPVLAQYWTDGRRTIADIGRLIHLETGLEISASLLEYFRFAESVGVVKLKDPSDK